MFTKIQFFTFFIIGKWFNPMSIFSPYVIIFTIDQYFFNHVNIFTLCQNFTIDQNFLHRSILSPYVSTSTKCQYFHHRQIFSACHLHNMSLFHFFCFHHQFQIFNICQYFNQSSIFHHIPILSQYVKMSTI